MIDGREGGMGFHSCFAVFLRAVDEYHDVRGRKGGVNTFRTSSDIRLRLLLLLRGEAFAICQDRHRERPPGQ